MLQIKPGQHGSTYGGNPLGTKIAIEALKVGGMAGTHVTHWPLGEKILFFKLIMQNNSLGTRCEIALSWMPQNLISEKSIIG